MSRIRGLHWLWPVVVAVIGVLGMATVWAVVSLWTRQPCAWLSLVAAADMALLLRLAGAPPGKGRMALAVVGTALTVLLAYWMVVATQMGQAMGLKPLDSALRLGSSLAWDISRMNQDGWDLAWLLVSLPLAAWWAKGKSQPGDKG